MAPHSRVHSSGYCTLGDHFAVVATKLSGIQSRLSQSLYWKSLLPICWAYMLPALFFVHSTWSSQVVSHPSTILAQSCWTSVFKCELVFKAEPHIILGVTNANWLVLAKVFLDLSEPDGQHFYLDFRGAFISDQIKPFRVPCGHKKVRVINDDLVAVELMCWVD